MTEEGVHFRSPLTGEEIFWGRRSPSRSSRSSGADIMFAFDECPPPGATHEYMKQSLARTHRWAKRSLAARKSKQALYGIVQGADFEDLRKQGAQSRSPRWILTGSASAATSANQKTSRGRSWWVIPLLDQKQSAAFARHRASGGYRSYHQRRRGTFDCTVPTHYARRGIAFVSKKSGARGGSHEGRVDFSKASLLEEKVRSTWSANAWCARGIPRVHRAPGTRERDHAAVPCSPSTIYFFLTHTWQRCGKR